MEPAAAASASHVLTATEGGIPPAVAGALSLVAGEDAAQQSRPGTMVARDARIDTVPVEESLAIPDARLAVAQPADWPRDVRGMPAYRPREAVDFATRPMGQNTGEFIFLTLMLSGVQAIGYANTAWRSTVGRITDRFWKYEIGGSW